MTVNEGDRRHATGNANSFPASEPMDRDEHQTELPETITATVIKASKTDNVGLALGFDKDGYMIISHLHERGLFKQQTSLQPNMRILQVNGVTVDRNTPLSRVQPMIQEKMLRQVTVVVKPSEEMTAQNYDWSKHQDQSPTPPKDNRFEPDRSQVPLNRTCCYLCPKYCDAHTQNACCWTCCVVCFCLSGGGGGPPR